MIIHFYLHNINTGIISKKKNNNNNIQTNQLTHIPNVNLIIYHINILEVG